MMVRTLYHLAHWLWKNLESLRFLHERIIALVIKLLLLMTCKMIKIHFSSGRFSLYISQVQTDQSLEIHASGSLRLTSLKDALDSHQRRWIKLNDHLCFFILHNSIVLKINLKCINENAMKSTVWN